MAGSLDTGQSHERGSVCGGLGSKELVEQAKVFDMIRFLISVNTARNPTSTVPSPQPLSLGSVVLHYCLLASAAAVAIYL